MANPNPNPTPNQKQVGNYRKKHVRWAGLDVSVENAKGQPRVAKDNSWRVDHMPADYGYIRRTEGADGDHVDVYLGDKPAAPHVYVIDQIDPKSGDFDEHKVMAGFESGVDAHKTYCKGFSDAKGPDRCGSMAKMSVERFKGWLAKGDTKKPVSYKGQTGRRFDPSAPVVK